MKYIYKHSIVDVVLKTRNKISYPQEVVKKISILTSSSVARHQDQVKHQKSDWLEISAS